MRIRHLLALAVIAPFASACTENPVFPDHDVELSAEVVFSVAELATLSEFTVTVHVEDHAGDHVTTMAEVRVEFQHHDATEWEAVLLSLQGEEYASDHTFLTSGDYDVRVIGIESLGAAEVILYEAVEHLEVERAHIEVGAYRIEMETFPGEVHEGAEAEVRFWIMEAEADTDGHHHMMGGLVAEIHCTDADGTLEEHMPHEEEPGIYEAHHTFLEAGEAHFEIHFQIPGGGELEGGFHVPVEHQH